METRVSAVIKRRLDKIVRELIYKNKRNLEWEKDPDPPGQWLPMLHDKGANELYFLDFEAGIPEERVVAVGWFEDIILPPSPLDFWRPKC